MTDRVVFKYPLMPNVGPQLFALPGIDPKVILVARDPASNTIAVWVEHDHPDHAIGYVERVFMICATGLLPTAAADGTHVGSVIIDTFVFHVYEV